MLPLDTRPTFALEDSQGPEQKHDLVGITAVGMSIV